MRFVARGRDWRQLIVALCAVGLISITYLRWLPVTNATIVALTYLLVVLLVAASSHLWVAVITSCVAMALFNFFFLPPVGTWRIADPENWVALVAFLTVSLVGSRLSAAARDREAIAIERAQFLEERKGAELARQGEELKSALLASLAHDLRTPLTAIRVAASNLQGTWLTGEQRREQSDLVLAEVERLTRLFQNILEMARIDAGAIAAEQQWVHPSQIVEAARGLVDHTLGRHPVVLETDSDRLVRLDPRLTASALAHLLENAAQYAPVGSKITVSTRVTAEELYVVVRDQGPGISSADLPHLFERFYRGGGARGRRSGTGMGLSIARGLLAAERGRIWAENCADGGAQFSITVPVTSKPAVGIELAAT
jgi:two-component system sensor histidine kinase KdpD